MIRIVEAPGIAGDHTWRIRTNTKGGRSLQTIGPHSRPDRMYFYVVEENAREYPFGTYTNVHYTTFVSRDDAEEYASWHTKGKA